MDNKKKVSEILKRLKKEYPEQKTALKHANPFELLVATILSAQATDAHVNKVTGALFKKYRTVKDYATTPVESGDSRGTGHPGKRTKNAATIAVIPAQAGIQSQDRSLDPRLHGDDEGQGQEETTNDT